MKHDYHLVECQCGLRFKLTEDELNAEGNLCELIPVNDMKHRREMCEEFNGDEEE